MPPPSRCPGNFSKFVLEREEENGKGRNRSSCWFIFPLVFSHLAVPPTDGPQPNPAQNFPPSIPLPAPLSFHACMRGWPLPSPPTSSSPPAVFWGKGEGREPSQTCLGYDDDDDDTDIINEQRVGGRWKTLGIRGSGRHHRVAPPRTAVYCNGWRCVALRGDDEFGPTATMSGWTFSFALWYIFIRRYKGPPRWRKKGTAE